MNGFILHPEHLDAASHASTDSKIRPALCSLVVFPDKVVSTDSYRLLEVTKSASEHERIILDAESLYMTRKAMRKNTELVGFVPYEEHTMKVSIKNGEQMINGIVCTRDKETRFPEYEQIIPKEKPLAFVSVSSEYLRELASYLEKHGHENNGHGPSVIIEIYGNNKPVLFHATTKNAHTVRAVLMPRRMEEEEINKRLPVKEEAKEEVKTDGDTIKVEDLPY